jgi:hypothetical protein
VTTPNGIPGTADMAVGTARSAGPGAVAVLHPGAPRAGTTRAALAAAAGPEAAGPEAAGPEAAGPAAAGLAPAGAEFLAACAEHPATAAAAAAIVAIAVGASLMFAG